MSTDSNNDPQATSVSDAAVSPAQTPGAKSSVKDEPVKLPPAPISKAPSSLDPDAPSVPPIPSSHRVILESEPDLSDGVKNSTSDNTSDAASGEGDSSKEKPSATDGGASHSEVSVDEIPTAPLPRVEYGPPGVSSAPPPPSKRNAAVSDAQSGETAKLRTPRPGPSLSGPPPAPSSTPPIRKNPSGTPPPAPSSGAVPPGRLKAGKTPLPPQPPRPIAAEGAPGSEAPPLPVEIRQTSVTPIDTAKDTPVPPATSWAPAPPGSVPDPVKMSTKPPPSAPVITTEELPSSNDGEPIVDIEGVPEDVDEYSPVPESGVTVEVDEAVAPGAPATARTPVPSLGGGSSTAPAIPPADRKPPPPRRSTKPSLPKVKQPRKKPWWETLFGDDFSRAYRPMSPSQLIREVDFILSCLEVPPGAVILDLGCGQGEICVELARRGYSVVGYDLSVYQLAMAGDNAQAAGQKINFLQGDMREMAFEQMFDAVICWDTTFGYFEEEKNIEVLGRIKKSLKPHGRLLLDVMNRDFAAREAPYTHWFEGDGCVCMDDMSLDWITNRLQVKRSIILDDVRSKELSYTTRLYTLSEVGRMLHDAGFRVAAVSGDVATTGAFFGPHSRRIIIQAGKP